MHTIPHIAEIIPEWPQNVCVRVRVDKLLTQPSVGEIPQENKMRTQIRTQINDVPFTRRLYLQPHMVNECTQYPPVQPSYVNGPQNVRVSQRDKPSMQPSAGKYHKREIDANKNWDTDRRCGRLLDASAFSHPRLANAHKTIRQEHAGSEPILG